MSLVFVTFTPPADQIDWSPDPFPGSRIAQDQGCCCPYAQPELGTHRFIFDSDCEVHELEEVKKH